MTRTVRIDMLAQSVAVSVETDDAGEITGIAAAGPCDPTRATIIQAVDAGLKRGRDLGTQLMRIRAMDRLICGLQGEP